MTPPYLAIRALVTLKDASQTLEKDSLIKYAKAREA